MPADPVLGIGQDADISHLNVSDFHPEWARALVFEHGIPTATRDGVWSGESAILGPDGNEIPLSQVILTHRAPDGTLEFISTIARNISEQKRVEAALRESEGRYQRIAANIPGVVYQFALHPDGSATFPFMSDGSRELFGLEPHELRDAQRTIDLIHPDDRASFDQSLAQSAASLTPWYWEGRSRLNSGELKWFQGASRPERQPNGDILWDGLLMDISDRKRAEEEVRTNEQRYRALISATAQIVWTTAASGEAVHASPSWCAFTGQSAEESIGWGWIKAIHPDDREQMGLIWKQSLESRRAYEVEYRLRRHDGQYHEFASPRRAYGGYFRADPRVDRHLYQYHRAQAGGGRAPPAPGRDHSHPGCDAT